MYPIAQTPAATVAAAAAARHAAPRLQRLHALMAGAFLLAAAALHAPTAQAAGERFALTCIGTEIGGVVHFQYRWGPSDEWKTASAKPGRWQAITYQYRFPGENRSPKLELRYDDDLSSRANWVRQKVNSFAARSHDCEGQGFTYNFVARSGELFLETEDTPAAGDDSV